MKKMIFWLISMVKSLFGRKKINQKRVLEKIHIDSKFKKKRLPASKKTVKKKGK